MILLRKVENLVCQDLAWLSNAPYSIRVEITEKYSMDLKICVGCNSGCRLSRGPDHSAWRSGRKRLMASTNDTYTDHLISIDGGETFAT